jgi:glycosyltransferase involved in cell wall biosynthesis
MKIGIDGTTLGGNRAGVGRYVFELCRALDRQLPHAEFFVYSHIQVEMPVESPRWHSRVEPTPAFAKLRNILWLKLRAPILCRKDRLDAFWACGTFLPNLPPSVWSVVTVYDMNRWLVKDTMKWTAYVAHKLFIGRDIIRAKCIVAISYGTAKRQYEILGRRADFIVPPAVSAKFHRPNDDVITSTITKLGIQTPFFLAVGTLEPRKNLALLIEVFVNLKREGNLPAHQLILVGGKGWNDTALRTLLIENQDAGIKHLGYVDDSDLPSLFAGSDAFVFPSIYEGFGMPVLEARACAARVIASDIPEIREAGGIGPIYIEPTPEALKSALLQIGANKGLGKTTADFSLSRWDESAADLARALCSGQTKF